MISSGWLWWTWDILLHLIDLLTKLYRKQLAKVKVAGTLLEWFRAGVRQGCVLFPYLFNNNILAEMVTREILDGFQGGLQIDHEPSLCWWHHPVGHFEGRTTGVGGASSRPSQPHYRPLVDIVFFYMIFWNQVVSKSEGVRPLLQKVGVRTPSPLLKLRLCVGTFGKSRRRFTSCSCDTERGRHEVHL